MRIAIFDNVTTANNPTGGCNRQLLAGLCREHDFTVFSAAFANPCPDRIQWVRIPVPMRPLVLLFVCFHIMAPLCLLWHRLRGGKAFDVIQIAESNLLLGHVSYAHFCHRAFLNDHWTTVRPGGLRGVLRWLDHWFHAVLESWVYRRMTRVVTPSRGLADELVRHYPELAGKIVVIANPVDLDKMCRPHDFDRRAFRASLGIQDRDIALIFCALGHFERKGLGLLLDALENLPQFPWKLIVVGGQPDALKPYRSRGSDRVVYAGMQTEIGPFLWASEAFVLPSAYETFSLVSFEAAAAAVPLLAPRLYGVDELLRDGENGFLLVREKSAIEIALQRLFRLSVEARLEMGMRAQRDVASYCPEAFVEGWREFYRTLEPDLCHNLTRRVSSSQQRSAQRP
jgi:glycosyltransferase involved in cell wall biosynthesis